MLDTANEVKNLQNQFDEFTKETNSVVNELRDSMKRVLANRKDAGISSNDNIFDRLKQTKDDRAKLIFGRRGKGVYNDVALKEVEKLIKQRSQELEEVVLERARTEQMVSGSLTIISVFLILMVWFKLKKSMSGKLLLKQLGGFGGPGVAQVH